MDAWRAPTQLRLTMWRFFEWATPDNFPFVNDYRNPLLAEAMKVLGMVNKYNRGIAKVKQELEKNGNPAAQFDVNKLTEFRVTICACQESGTIKLGSSLPGNVSGKSLGEDAVSGARNAGTKSGSGACASTCTWECRSGGTQS